MTRRHREDVSVPTTASIIGPDGAVQPIALRYIYNVTDPCAVTLRFLLEGNPGAVCWKVARDNLAAAVMHDGLRVGVGDVVLARFGSALVIHLESHEGVATVATPVEAAWSFVRLSSALVPLGGERVDVDAVIAACLGASS